MVKDAKVKANIILELLLQLFKKEVGNPKFLFGLNTYIKNLFKYMPSSVSKDLYVKVFQLMFDLMNTTDNKEVKNLLAQNLIYFATSKENILKLYKKYEEINENKNSENKDQFSEDGTLQILLKVLLNISNEEALKEKVEHSLQNMNKSTTVNNYLIKLEYARTKVEKRQEVWEQVLVNKERKLSFKELQFALQGFRSSLKTNEDRRLYMDKYFNIICDIIQNEKLKFAEALFTYLVPSIHDLALLEEKYSETLVKVRELKNEFFINKIVEKIDDLQRVQKTFALFK
jgi:hypothetical protein